MCQKHLQLGREPVQFLLPVSNQRRRHDQQKRGGFIARLRAAILWRWRLFVGLFQLQNQIDDLNRFAETHVVGKASSQSQLSHKPQPANPVGLIRSQGRIQFDARIAADNAMRITNLLQDFGEPRAGRDR